MRYTADVWFNLLNEVGRIDPELECAFFDFADEDVFQTLSALFDETNFSRFDRFSDEQIEVDTSKAFKKILRGKDVSEVILAAFDMGRMVGTAEQKLLAEDTPCGK